VVITQELPRWHKGPNGPVEGLKRRRAAEVSHARMAEATSPQHQTKTAAPVPSHKPIQLLDAVHHHKGLAHQQEAWLQLERSLTAEQRDAFAKVFRTPASPSKESPKTDTPGLIQLPVPYLSQNDSATSQGPRMCFSSSCAMAAAFLRPDALQGPGQRDDHYLALVQRYGDTTDASAQVKAMQSLGLQARFRTDGSIAHLIEQLKRGLPSPVGWLHKGPISAPSGGGHWSLVIGWEPAKREFLMHDPNGEGDLVNGGYVNTAIGSGKDQRYSERNWGRRWMVEGAGTGWWIEISPGS
jgi:hypothetical protein